LIHRSHAAPTTNRKGAKGKKVIYWLISPLTIGQGHIAPADMRSEYSNLIILYGSSFFQDKATTTHKVMTSTTAELNQASSVGAKSLQCNHANAPQLFQAAQALIL
jgi:hypothetical protein